MRRGIAALCMALAPMPAMASEGDFRCSNAQAEIRCAEGACEIVSAEQGFTPMELSRLGNSLSLCAYSGCWEGPIATRSEQGGVTLMQARVVRQGGEDASAADEGRLLSVIHDASNDVAQMRWDGFANVMECAKPD